MSTYGPIAYEDFSLLNAQWSQARPPMAGLGSFYGQHEYRDLSFLNARLKPTMPAQVGLSPDGLGGGSLSGNSLGIAGLGASSSTWIDWYNKATADQQDEFDAAAHVIDAGGAVPDDVSPAVHEALVLYKNAGGRDALVPASTTFTAAQITAAQNLVNASLAKAGYQQIGVDGKLGPATCGALIWYQKNVDSKGGVSFMADCAQRALTNPPRPPTKLSSGGGGGGGGSAVPPTTPKGPAQSNMLLYGGAFAAIAIGGALIYRASSRRR
jgi:hypothetical protein